MTRFANKNWNLNQTPNGGIETWEQAQIAVLMDIRDEMKRMNAILGCPNFTRIPRILDEINMNTERMAKRKKSKR